MDCPRSGVTVIHIGLLLTRSRRSVYSSKSRIEDRGCEVHPLGLGWPLAQPRQSVLTLCALSVAFALFGTVISLNAAYERAIVDTRMDRLTDGSQFASSDEKIGLAAMAAL